MTRKALPRFEDARLLTGRGRFTANANLPGQAVAMVLRSPEAHGRITKLDISGATEVEGVLTILTAAVLDKIGAKPMPVRAVIDSTDGTPFKTPPRDLLARDVVRFVGDPIAFIVAETEAAAQDAIEAIELDIEPLPAVTDPERSEDVACVYEEGDASAVEAAIAQAAHVVTLYQRHDRIAVSPIEPRSALGQYVDGKYTLTTQTQGVHFVQRLVAETLNIPKERLRVVTGDVGGSFGIKLMPYPEQSLVLFAAKLVGRPVLWTSTRSEAFLSDAHGRGQVGTGTLALDGEGKILALKADLKGDLGAYASAIGANVLTLGFFKTFGHAYHIPAIFCRVTVVHTNAAPTDAYRGAGKPEAQYLMERLINKAGRLFNGDALSVRRRNLIPAEAMPYPAANGFTYDSARFETVMNHALEAGDWAGFAARKAVDASKGLKRGIGLSNYLHLTGGSATEHSEVRLLEDGNIEVLTGIQASGQGHETAIATLVSERLRIDATRVNVIEGDTARLDRGGGTGGSSSITIAGVSILKATDRLIEAMREAASENLETAPQDLELAEGGFQVVGTDRRIDLPALAAAVPESEERICGMADSDHEIQTVPHGTCIVEVVVDPETGWLDVDRVLAVDDLGVRLNPGIAEGQIHGGLAQAIGQALQEQVVFDPESGQLLTGSLMDYRLPRAGDFPDYQLIADDVPTQVNDLGMKGVGELSSIGGIAAAMNAVCDALDAPDLDMPMTPQKIWSAIQQG